MDLRQDDDEYITYPESTEYETGELEPVVPPPPNAPPSAPRAVEITPADPYLPPVCPRCGKGYAIYRRIKTGKLVCRVCGCVFNK